MGEMSKSSVIMIIVIIGCMAWNVFAVFGVCQLWTYNERVRLTETWKIRAIRAELKAEKYERITAAFPKEREG